MAGYATSGRGWHNPTVAGLLRRDERVHAQSIKLVDCLCRVIASIFGYFPGDCTDVVDGAAACCLSEVWFVARAATITW